MTTSDAPEVGQTAPDFTLLDQSGTEVTLSALRGSKVIVYFYAEANTPACTKQACDFRDNLGTLEDAGYRVIGISRDPQPKLAKFATDEQLTFPVLSDPDHVVHDLYAAFGQKQMYGRTVTGVIRSTYVLDENGVITMALRNIKATGHVAMLRKRLGLTA
ncbi:MAG TPA: thioredoxin-dependent thiol peroxidase [Pseudolysinimonas sp.]|nr:thioredoxin-dependent thiol peroxidase [Pseudolysinimonas sp.]